MIIPHDIKRVLLKSGNKSLICANSYHMFFLLLVYNVFFGLNKGWIRKIFLRLHTMNTMCAEYLVKSLWFPFATLEHTIYFLAEHYARIVTTSKTSSFSFDCHFTSTYVWPNKAGRIVKSKDAGYGGHFMPFWANNINFKKGKYL